MQEQALFRLSVLVAVFGLFFLYWYADGISLEPAQNLDAIKPEETVTLRGIISQVQAHDKVLFLRLDGERKETADVILFTDNNVFLREGDTIEVTGTVEEYQGKKEVVASSVMLK